MQAYQQVSEGVSYRIKTVQNAEMFDSSQRMLANVNDEISRAGNESFSSPF